MSNDPIARLKKLLAALPGMGAKSGARLAYHLIEAPGTFTEDLAHALLEAREKIKPCPRCGAPASSSPCPICADPERDQSLVMILESPLDLEAVEKTRAYNGLYHVLGGTLSPLAGRGPESLRLQELLDRIGREPIKEIILATNPTSEGDSTAACLEELIEQSEAKVKVTRLGRGLPSASEIRHLDPRSLEFALKGRKQSEE